MPRLKGEHKKRKLGVGSLLYRHPLAWNCKLKNGLPAAALSQSRHISQIHFNWGFHSDWSRFFLSRCFPHTPLLPTHTLVVCFAHWKAHAKYLQHGLRNRMESPSFKMVTDVVSALIHIRLFLSLSCSQKKKKNQHPPPPASINVTEYLKSFPSTMICSRSIFDVCFFACFCLPGFRSE